ncbi:hypothetical protein [Phycicoccus sonneratiae]|uniref:DUF4386 family protein n=1 Tax=Phycicoccus sonneratiae TaxID=2807628 RepID=A0ABS2CHE9_9MICO|nr:hypothetical protein [Phycicoccus sonneraticus]MBM6399305.1 hypothetical protein [Phycicoccus sonneraticus]
MSSTQTTHPAPTSARTGPRRLVGAAAVATAVAVVAENAVFAASGAPGYDTPVDEVLAYYAGHRGVVAFAAGLVAVYLPLLLVVLTGLRGLGERRDGVAALWSRLAVAAGSVVSAVLVLVNVLQVGLALSVDSDTEPTPALELVWRVHAAGFAFVLPVLGATVAAAALATDAAGVTPRWQRLLGLGSGGLLLAAGVGTLAVADGSPLIVVGLLGFAGFLVWLLATGLRLLRA